MSFKHIVPRIINQIKLPVLPVSQVKTEAAMVIKNEPLDSEMLEIGVNDIPDSLDIPDLIDVDILDKIKSETVFIQSANTPFIKTENITQNETLSKTEDISDGNANRDTDGQETIEIQGSIEHVNAVETNKGLLVLAQGISARSKKAKHSKNTTFRECNKTIETTSWKKDNEKLKAIEIRQMPYSCDQCGYKTSRTAHIKRHKLTHLKPEEGQYFYCYHCSFKSRHKRCLETHIFRHHCKNVVKQKQKSFPCDHCDFKTHLRATLKRHNLIHLKPEESQYFYCYHCSFKSKHKSSVQTHIFRRHFKNVEIEQKEKRFLCDRCNFKTYLREILKRHNLIHLKPEEIQYFYCSHCFFKSMHKGSLRRHVLMHFQREEVKFHCYICDFMTLKRESIIDHIKKHSKGRNKSKINEGS